MQHEKLKQRCSDPAYSLSRLAKEFEVPVNEMMGVLDGLDLSTYANRLAKNIKAAMREKQQ